MSTCEGTGFRGEGGAWLCADRRGFVWSMGTRYFWKRWRCGSSACEFTGFLLVALESRLPHYCVAFSMGKMYRDLLVKKLYSRSEAMNRYKLIPAVHKGPCTK